jgi:hypothetical protein
MHDCQWLCPWNSAESPLPWSPNIIVPGKITTGDWQQPSLFFFCWIIFQPSWKSWNIYALEPSKVRFDLSRPLSSHDFRLNFGRLRRSSNWDKLRTEGPAPFSQYWSHVALYFCWKASFDAGRGSSSRRSWRLIQRVEWWTFWHSWVFDSAPMDITGSSQIRFREMGRRAWILVRGSKKVHHVMDSIPWLPTAPITAQNWQT